jgi:hypothetical protein
MPTEPRVCRQCGQKFIPSVFRPSQQQTCSAPECQKRRKAGYHRARYRSDPEYRRVCRESDGKWRERQRGYQARYRQAHSDYVERNRRAQSRRDRKRKLRDLVKNNSAIDVKSTSADVWLAGAGIDDLVKNNLAVSEILIFQAVGKSARAAS